MLFRSSGNPALRAAQERDAAERAVAATGDAGMSETGMSLELPDEVKGLLGP